MAITGRFGFLLIVFALIMIAAGGVAFAEGHQINTVPSGLVWGFGISLLGIGLVCISLGSIAMYAKASAIGSVVFLNGLASSVLGAFLLARKVQHTITADEMYGLGAVSVALPVVCISIWYGIQNPKPSKKKRSELDIMEENVMHSLDVPLS